MTEEFRLTSQQEKHKSQKSMKHLSREEVSSNGSSVLKSKKRLNRYQKHSKVIQESNFYLCQLLLE
jgi:hypothetical protein